MLNSQFLYSFLVHFVYKNNKLIPLNPLKEISLILFRYDKGVIRMPNVNFLNCQLVRQTTNAGVSSF